MLTVAIIALVLSAASLSWQIIAWLTSGPALAVHATVGTTWGPLGTDNFVAIEVTNNGRAAGTVGGVGFLTPQGKQLVGLESYIKRVELPKRLDPYGDQFDYWYKTSEIHAHCAENSCKTEDLVPFARLGVKRIQGTWAKLPSRR